MREFELERTFSLAQVDAAALLDLRRNGSAQVTLREAMYDLDHPGLLMRRLRRVALSVPAVAGPYVNVNASLRLEKAWLRVGAGASAADASSVMESSASVVLSTLAGRTEILTSSGRDDDGVFDGAGDARLLPFEGYGAVSQWALTPRHDERQTVRRLAGWAGTPTTACAAATAAPAASRPMATTLAVSACSRPTRGGGRCTCPAARTCSYRSAQAAS